MSDINFDLNKRIKEVRNYTGLSQRSFGEKLGISGAGIAQYENGRNNPSEQTIRAICNEFNINRLWLETGAGEMIDPQLDDDIDAIMAIMHGQSETKKRIMRIAASMPDDLLNAFVSFVSDQIKKGQ